MVTVDFLHMYRTYLKFYIYTLGCFGISWYSGDPNARLLWYSNSLKQYDPRMVLNSDHDMKTDSCTDTHLITCALQVATLF